MRKSHKSQKRLTLEDSEIWGRVTNSAKPLAKRARNYSNIFSQMVQSGTPETRLTNPSSPGQLRPGIAPAYRPTLQPAPTILPRQIDQKTTKKISKGKISMDGKLDLHGYTQKDAHRALFDYIENAYFANKRTILVITGKGNLGRGILRENVPKWLGEAAFTRLISGFGPSNPSHGGIGALYVRIRKKS